jgi:hypothetical protein
MKIMYCDEGKRTKAGGPMPHYKCVECRTRAFHSGLLGDPVIGDRCPGCGAVWAPVGALSEVMGYSMHKPRGTVIQLSPAHVIQQTKGRS